jgi:hypothetical protein
MRQLAGTQLHLVGNEHEILRDAIQLRQGWDGLELRKSGE